MRGRILRIRRYYCLRISEYLIWLEITFKVFQCEYTRLQQLRCVYLVCRWWLLLYFRYVWRYSIYRYENGRERLNMLHCINCNFAEPTQYYVVNVSLIYHAIITNQHILYCFVYLHKNGKNEIQTTAHISKYLPKQVVVITDISQPLHLQRIMFGYRWLHKRSDHSSSIKSLYMIFC